MCGNSIFAHEPNEAFFSFAIKETTIEVEAEFPWTMRNALLEYNPSLKKSTRKKDFEDTFFAYLRENLILKDSKGNVLSIKEFQKLENNGHSHQNNYLIIFKGTDLQKVTNTIMLNLYKNQVNYNMIKIGSSTKMFKTSETQKHFDIINGKNNQYFKYLLILIIPFIYLAYRWFNKKTTANTGYK